MLYLRHVSCKSCNKLRDIKTVNETKNSVLSDISSTNFLPNYSAKKDEIYVIWNCSSTIEKLQ